MNAQAKRLTPRALTLKQKVALPVAAAIYSALAHEILDVPDGHTAEKVTAEALQFAETFLSLSGAQA